MLLFAQRLRIFYVRHGGIAGTVSSGRRRVRGTDVHDDGRKGGLETDVRLKGRIGEGRGVGIYRFVALVALWRDLLWCIPFRGEISVGRLLLFKSLQKTYVPLIIQTINSHEEQSMPHEIFPNSMSTMDPICQILTPVGMLGYGFNTEEFTTSLSSLTLSHPGVPTAVILDSGSTDSGPTKLASGSMSCPRSAYVRDLRKLLMAIKRFEGVRVLVGSCGGDGVDAHVDVMEEIVREIAEER